MANSIQTKFNFGMWDVMMVSWYLICDMVIRTVVNNNKNEVEHYINTTPKMKSSRYSNKSTSSKYVPPNKRTTNNPLEKPDISTEQSGPKRTRTNDIFSSSVNFPALISSKMVMSSKSSTPVITPSLDFKGIAEKSAHLPDPAIITPPPITDDVESVANDKETYDLSAYVRLQERRESEYDYLYGLGAFARDRLNYEKYSSASESNSSSEEEEEDADEDLMDY